MSDIWLHCDTCKGLRYNQNILSHTYKNLSIGDILQLTVQEALNFFDAPELLKNLQVLQDVGVGHLQLGQAGNSLSGGEAQRLKLATALLQKRKGKVLFLFDEPSTGLHYLDLLKLISVFEALVENGDTILFIEHNEVLIERADEVLRLGPGSGDNGGGVVWEDFTFHRTDCLKFETTFPSVYTDFYYDKKPSKTSVHRIYYTAY